MDKTARKARRVFVPILASLLGLITASCTNSTAGPSSPSEQTQLGSITAQSLTAKTLTIGRAYDIKNLDPALMATAGDIALSSDLFSGIYKFKPGSTKIVNDLAADTSVSSNGLKWTIQLRHDAKFAAGYGKVTAADVVFTFERLLDPATKAPQSALLSAISKVKALAPDRVRITLSQKDPILRQKLASYYTRIVSQDAVKKLGQKFDTHPVGSGPYYVKTWSPKNELVLLRNTQYFGEKPEVPRIVIKPIPNPATLFGALSSGEIDMARISDETHYAKYSESKGFKLYSTPLLSTRMISFNTSSGPMSNLSARKAFAYAINQKQMLNTILAGLSAPGDNLLPPNTVGRVPSLITYTYDPDKAKSILQQAGFDLPVKVTLTVPNDPRFTIPATVIQQSASSGGFKVALNKQETQSVVADLTSSRAKDMTILSHTFQPDPGNVLSAMLSTDGVPSTNWSYVKNAQANKLVQKLDTVAGDARVKVLEKLQSILAKEYYGYYIDYEKYIWALKSEYTHFVPSPARVLNLYTIDTE